MSSSDRVTVQESHPMNSGDGTYSYSKNSYHQRAGFSVALPMINEAILEKLDIKALSSTSDIICVADLGCSVGPNSFVCMQKVVEAIKLKYQSQCLAANLPEFQVFFNDHASNDFNTLFTSLPERREYYAAGVPGSFHGQVFPSSSLHFAHSSYAIQWLSEVPKKLLDINSSAWNKGRIHYTNAGDEVVDAYSAQFAKDMERFLDSRAKELVVGGMMIIMTLGIPNGMSFYQLSTGVMFDVLGSSLMDMAKEGIISEAQVDSFNLPIYTPSPKEMKEIVERNGCFSIERIELTNARSKTDQPVDIRSMAMHLRAGMEGIISKHFGNGIIDELFGRFLKNLGEFYYVIESSNKEGTQLFVVLKRK